MFSHILSQLSENVSLKYENVNGIGCEQVIFSSSISILVCIQQGTDNETSSQ